MLLGMLLACQGLPAPSSTTVPGTLGPLGLVVPLHVRTGEAVGAAQLQVVTARPARLEVRWDDQLRTWPAAESHDVPLVGLGVDRRVDVEIVLESEDGARIVTTWPLELDPIRGPVPDIEVFAHQPDRTEPGHVLVYAKPPDDRGVMLLFDEALEVVWSWRPTQGVGDLRPYGDDLLFLGGGNIWTMDWLGQTTPVLTKQGREPGGTLAAGLHLHHEVFPLDDGGWLSLDYRSISVERYPDVEGGEPAQVLVEQAVELAADGALVRDARFEQLLDLGRTTGNSLDTTSAGYDWIHTNGIIEDPRDGGWIVSSRHQSALFEIDGLGQLDWLLADPGGWDERFSDVLLTPEGEVTWPDAQHAPELDDDVLVVFDNRMESREPARVVGYRIDEVARTVEEAFVLDQTATGPERSQALGDADVQPVTGNVFATYGFLDGWGGQTADEMGIGKRAIALVEWSLDTPEAPVLDLRLSQRDRDGWKAYRAEKLRVPGDGTSER